MAHVSDLGCCEAPRWTLNVKVWPVLWYRLVLLIVVSNIFWAQIMSGCVIHGQKEATEEVYRLVWAVRFKNGCAYWYGCRLSCESSDLMDGSGRERVNVLKFRRVIVPFSILVLIVSFSKDDRGGLSGRQNTS